MHRHKSPRMIIDRGQHGRILALDDLAGVIIDVVIPARRHIAQGTRHPAEAAQVDRPATQIVIDRRVAQALLCGEPQPLCPAAPSLGIGRRALGRDLRVAPGAGDRLLPLALHLGADHLEPEIGPRLAHRGGQVTAERQRDQIEDIAPRLARHLPHGMVTPLARSGAGHVDIK